ncbi:hypothetical protein KPB05_37355 [Burkholderia gladioli]|uniref:hypothetical protein n=1 Tax=Burkholderia gladioli TaxID=28095 RepID=UPI00285916A0|nr:hypothetical protein [Burkholderia gladioli]MDR8093127.1 hypothetical protein [Burkholderia gladioli]
MPHADGYERLVLVEYADEQASIGDDGTLHYGEKGRSLLEAESGQRVGLPPLDGRLFRISYLTRDWQENYPEGPAISYALTMLVLLAQPETDGVWYENEWNLQFDVSLAPVTKAAAHQLIDRFVAIGMRRD